MLVIVMDHSCLQVYWDEWEPMAACRVDRHTGRSKTLWFAVEMVGWWMVFWIVWLSRCRMAPCWSVLRSQPPSTAQQGWFVKMLLSCLNIYAWQELSIVVQLQHLHTCAAQSLTPFSQFKCTCDLMDTFFSSIVFVWGDVVFSSVHAAHLVNT